MIKMTKVANFIRKEVGFSKEVFSDEDGVKRIGHNIVIANQDKHDVGDKPFTRENLNVMFNKKLRKALKAAQRNVRDFNSLTEMEQKQLILEAFNVGEERQASRITAEKAIAEPMARTFAQATAVVEEQPMTPKAPVKPLGHRSEPEPQGFNNGTTNVRPSGQIQRYNQGTTNVRTFGQIQGYNQGTTEVAPRTFGSVLGDLFGANTNNQRYDWKNSEGYKQQQEQKELQVRNQLRNDESWSNTDAASHGIQGVFSGLEGLLELPGAAYGGVRRGIDYIQGKDAYEGQYGYEVSLTPESVEQNATEARTKAEAILKSQGMLDEEIKEKLDAHFGAQEIAGSLVDPTIAITTGPKLLKLANTALTDPDLIGNVKNAWDYARKSDDYDAAFWGRGREVDLSDTLSAGRTPKARQLQVDLGDGFVAMNNKVAPAEWLASAGITDVAEIKRISSNISKGRAVDVMLPDGSSIKIADANANVGKLASADKKSAKAKNKLYTFDNSGAGLSFEHGGKQYTAREAWDKIDDLNAESDTFTSELQLPIRAGLIAQAEDLKNAMNKAKHLRPKTTLADVAPSTLIARLNAGEIKLSRGGYDWKPKTAKELNDWLKSKQDNLVEIEDLKDGSFSTVGNSDAKRTMTTNEVKTANQKKAVERKEAKAAKIVEDAGGLDAKDLISVKDKPTQKSVRANLKTLGDWQSKIDAMPEGNQKKLATDTFEKHLYRQRVAWNIAGKKLKSEKAFPGILN